MTKQHTKLAKGIPTSKRWCQCYQHLFGPLRNKVWSSVQVTHQKRPQVVLKCFVTIFCTIFEPGTTTTRCLPLTSCQAEASKSTIVLWLSRFVVNEHTSSDTYVLSLLYAYKVQAQWFSKVSSFFLALYKSPLYSHHGSWSHYNNNGRQF